MACSISFASSAFNGAISSATDDAPGCGADVDRGANADASAGVHRGFATAGGFASRGVLPPARARCTALTVLTALTAVRGEGREEGRAVDAFALSAARPVLVLSRFEGGAGGSKAVRAGRFERTRIEGGGME